MPDNFTLVRGRALRVTKLDSCGEVVPGPRNQVTTKGAITIGFTPNNEEGTTITVVNANGDNCVLDRPAPKFQNFTVELNLCGVNPDLFELLTGNPAVQDDSDEGVGFDVGTDIDLDGVAFALELWSLVPGQECAGSARTYGYMLAPYVQGGSIGDFTWQNDAINFTVSGAVTKDGNGWGVGPYNVVRNSTGVPSPLPVAIGSKKHLRVIATTLAPPSTDDVGAQPVGVPATLITAGIPATLTPSNSYPPATLATMGSVTKTPTTAWTAGQYVELQDGSTAHWTGTAWAAGPA